LKSLLAVSSGIVLAAAFASGFAISRAQARPGDQSPRFPELKMEQLNDAQRPLGEKILKVSSTGTLSGPNNLMLRSPDMGNRLFTLIDYLRFHTSIPLRLNEFAILIQARQWTSQFEWRAHYSLALRAGLEQSVIDDLAQGQRPAAMQPDEAVVYDMCMELSTRRELTDATFQRARSIFTEQQIVDLTAVSGTYQLLAMMLKTAADEGVPDAKTALLKPLPPR
jgi:4-carboxymuconolactone decarboxylase